MGEDRKKVENKTGRRRKKKGSLTSATLIEEGKGKGYTSTSENPIQIQINSSSLPKSLGVPFIGLQLKELKNPLIIETSNI